MAKTYEGNTRTAEGQYTSGAILGGPFWETGKTVTGKYVRSFPTPVGLCHEFLAFPKEIEAYITDDNKVTSDKNGNDPASRKVLLKRFSIGSLTGFEVALNDLKANGFDDFRLGDTVEITCTGLSHIDEYNTESPDFNLKVSR